MSKIIKKTISEQEELKQYFSLSNRYINIKISFILLKWIFIFIILSLVLFFIIEAQFFVSSEYNDINNQIFKLWEIIALIFSLIIIPAIIIFNVFYLKISNEFVFTDKRILVKKGWIETKVKTIYYNRITDISVSQNILDRIIKTGTISISTAGSDGYEAVLLHIKNPYQIKKDLYNIKMDYQKKHLSQTDEGE